MLLTYTNFEKINSCIIYSWFKGQPNRRTGVCETDKFVISGGSTRDITICGQNSGQHSK